jgi:hypothetical protein
MSTCIFICLCIIALTSEIGEIGLQLGTASWDHSEHDMKISTIVTILSASLLLLLTISATALLSDLTEPTADVRYEDLQVGYLLPMFCGPTLWSRLPSVPYELNQLIDSRAFAYVAVGIVTVSLIGWRWRFISRTGAAVVTLGLGFLPCVLGAIVLRDGTASPVAVGAWAGFMILALMYSAATALLLAISDLHRPRSCLSKSLNRNSLLAAQVR